LKKIKECFKQLNQKDQFSVYMNASVRPTAKVKNELYALIAEFDNETLFENKNYNAIINNLSSIIKDFKLNESVYKHTLYDLGLLYLNTMNDRSKAIQYFSQLETEYPKDILVTNAHYQLGIDADLSSNFSLSENSSNKENAIDTTQAKNIQEDKILTTYPNPFNPSTVVSYQLKTLSNVTLKVYDMLGREVVTLVDGIKEAGFYTAYFHGDNLATGIYFARLITTPQDGNKPSTRTMKMMLAK